ncbi:MAG: phosphate ABC transporter substrate-binding protein [Gammaproteobacteria bacterium]|nr:phosphate ABC transporter substrate-binding protein [Gammaproteobacteria bacterium]MDH5778622.1 phosphate ABC transporter substrate-binding protein [Gammaproteobacteria bacterium]
MKSNILAVVLFIVSVPVQVIAAPPATIGGEMIWAGCGITKKAFMKELARAYEAKTGIKITLQGGGATKGIRNVVKGEINIGGACRATIDTDPRERGAYQVPVAWDALVVIVNKKNPVDSITFDQLKGLYLGKINNWKQLGGPDQPIDLYTRQGKISGVGRTLREIVFANFDQDFRGKFVMKSSGPLEKGVVKNINGIATTGISSAKRRDVKILKLEGHAPSYENIKSGNYLLYRPLYLVTQGARSDPKVKDFITFALSRQGMEIIRKAGTVPYAEAIHLVMKQVEQYERAAQKGLYR